MPQAAVIRVQDLERQLSNEPAAPRSFRSRLFSWLFRIKKCSLPTSNESSDDNGSDSNNITASYSYFAQPQITTVDGTKTRSTTNDDGKMAAHDPISSAQSAMLSTPKPQTSTWLPTSKLQNFWLFIGLFSTVGRAPSTASTQFIQFSRFHAPVQHGLVSKENGTTILMTADSKEMHWMGSKSLLTLVLFAWWV